jgi:FAD/FMN-containing dehydrogenase
VSYKTLVDSLDAYEERTLYTEMEMFVPAELALDAVLDFLAYQDAVRPLLPADVDPSVSLFSQVRYLAADDIPLSPARGRATAVLSMIALGNKNMTAAPELFALYAHGLEEICATKYQGVPHWGKKNWATEEELVSFYGADAWNNFEELRSQIDPKGMFLNSYLRGRGVGSVITTKSALSGK